MKFHGFPDRVRYEDADWLAYVAANREFARHAHELVASDGTVWMHDYHLLLAGQALRVAGAGAIAHASAYSASARRAGSLSSIAVSEAMRERSAIGRHGWSRAARSMNTTSTGGLGTAMSRGEAAGAAARVQAAASDTMRKSFRGVAQGGRSRTIPRLTTTSDRREALPSHRALPSRPGAARARDYSPALAYPVRAFILATGGEFMKMMSLLMISLALDSIAGCQSEKKDGVSAKAVEGSERKTMEKPQNVDDQRGDVREAQVTSRDGTKIAFTRTGKGPAVIIVSGALSSRELYGDNPLIARLSEHFTVYTYDRRGRGESTDVQPYAVEREIEDIEALIHHAGHSAYLYGVSSGAALALQAAAKLGPAKVPKLALYEPPYGQERAVFAKQKQRVNELVKTGEPGDAAAYFLAAIGTPPEALEGMKRSPEWAAIKKIDFTLAYDFAVLGDGAVPQDTARAITVPALVMAGEKTMAFMHPTADRLAKLMPRAERKTLAGQTHQVQADAMAPVLIAFFAPAFSEG